MKKLKMSSIKNPEELKILLSKKVYNSLITEDEQSDERTHELITWHLNEFSNMHNFSLETINECRLYVFNKFRRLDILQVYMDDDSITEIMVNGPNKIFIEKDGRLIKSHLSFNSKEELNNLVLNYFARNNINLSISKPSANMKLADGSRAHAIIPPLAPDGPILTIRKFTGIKPQIEELIANKFMTREIAKYLQECIEAKKAIIIGGGTGSGKTTLLNVLSKFINPKERIVSIEDSPELQLQDKENWVKLIYSEFGNENSLNYGINQVIKNSLRMRPDRIIVGEVRGKEADAMLKAAQTGHPGTLCTIHANSALNIINRLADLVLEDSNLPYSEIIKLIKSSFQIYIFVERNAAGARYIKEVLEINKELNLEQIYMNRGENV